MEKPIIYMLNINPVNYTNFNWQYDYYAMTHGMSQASIPKEVFGIDIENNKNMRFDVKKYYLPDRNIAWLVSSNVFKNYYIFLLNPITKDEVIVSSNITYYKNVCVKCGKHTTAFEPLPKVSYGGHENAVYLCSSCRNAIVRALPRLNRKNIKRTTLEIQIANILDNIGVEYEQEKPFDIGVFNKIVDFYIPCGKVIIEGNGLAYHTSAITSKLESKHGKEAFFVSVMKDIISAYELTRLGYEVYIITEADIVDYNEISKVPTVKPERLNAYKLDYIKTDLEQLLTLRGCNIKPKLPEI